MARFGPLVISALTAISLGVTAFANASSVTEEQFLKSLHPPPTLSAAKGFEYCAKDGYYYSTNLSVNDSVQINTKGSKDSADTQNSTIRIADRIPESLVSFDDKGSSPDVKEVTGTGLIIDDSGYFLTAFHVVQDMLYRGYDTVLVDSVHDIAGEPEILAYSAEDNLDIALGKIETTPLKNHHGERLFDKNYAEPIEANNMYPGEPLTIDTLENLSGYTDSLALWDKPASGYTLLNASANIRIQLQALTEIIQRVKTIHGAYSTKYERESYPHGIIADASIITKGSTIKFGDSGSPVFTDDGKLAGIIKEVVLTGTIDPQITPVAVMVPSSSIIDFLSSFDRYLQKGCTPN